MAFNKIERRNSIKARVRKKISGTADFPRMTVFRSNTNISVQIIDDVVGKTLVSTASLVKDIASKKVTKTEQAALVGELIAKKAIESGISKVSFDRNGYLYHGRVKSLAEAARKGGLIF